MMSRGPTSRRCAKAFAVLGISVARCRPSSRSDGYIDVSIHLQLRIALQEEFSLPDRW
jgi:hypothetical protein